MGMAHAAKSEMNIQSGAADAGHERGDYVRSRLASLLALAPLGVWTVNHLWDNLSVYSGAAAWEQAVTHHSHPAALTATTTVVLLPLAMHTVWGIGRLRSSRPNNMRYGFYANFKYILQRLSAVGILLFLGAHIWLAFLHPRLQLGHPETFADLSSQMRTHIPTLAVYTLGTLGVAYHLANGVYGFAMGWGLVSSRAALKKLEVFVLLFFVLLLAMSWGVIYGMYQAGGK